jgi:plastocyanin
MARSWTRAALVLALVIGATFLFEATSLGETFRIRMAGSFPNFRYEPDQRRIDRNDRIRFKNPASQAVSHTVTAYGGNWDYNKTLSSGETVTKRFRRTGLFKFRCRFHSTLENGVCKNMCGKVRVTRPG